MTRHIIAPGRMVRGNWHRGFWHAEIMTRGYSSRGIRDTGLTSRSFCDGTCARGAIVIHPWKSCAILTKPRRRRGVFLARFINYGYGLINVKISIMIAVFLSSRHEIFVPSSIDASELAQLPVCQVRTISTGALEKSFSPCYECRDGLICKYE